MSRSIVQDKRECMICGAIDDLHRHHIIYGTANRKQSEQYGLTCYLCSWHHNMSQDSVHCNRDLDLKLKKFAQTKFEEVYKDKNFIEIFGKSYL